MQPNALNNSKSSWQPFCFLKKKILLVVPISALYEGNELTSWREGSHSSGHKAYNTKKNRELLACSLEAHRCVWFFFLLYVLPLQLIYLHSISSIVQEFKSLNEQLPTRSKARGPCTAHVMWCETGWVQRSGWVLLNYKE